MKKNLKKAFNKLSNRVDIVGEWIERHFISLITFVLTLFILITIESLLIYYSPTYLKYIKSIAVLVFYTVLVLIWIVAAAKKIRYTLLGFLIIIFSLIAPITNMSFDNPILLLLFLLADIFISIRTAITFSKFKFNGLSTVFYPVKKVTNKKYRDCGKEITETIEERNYSFVYILLLILPSIIQFIMSWLGKK